MTLEILIIDFDELGESEVTTETVDWDELNHLSKLDGLGYEQLNKGEQK